MNRLWVTARPSFAPIVETHHRRNLRRRYRQLRAAGIGRHHARWIICDLIEAAHLEVRP